MTNWLIRQSPNAIFVLSHGFHVYYLAINHVPNIDEIHYKNNLVNSNNEILEEDS